jgi:hypothetical protein
MKHIIHHGLDGTDGKVIGLANDMCEALTHIERILGGREIQLRIPPVNRGNECFMFCFIRDGKSEWIRTMKHYPVRHIEDFKPFDNVEAHANYACFA